VQAELGRSDPEPVEQLGREPGRERGQHHGAGGSGVDLPQGPGRKLG